MMMINNKVHDQEDCAQEGFCDYSSETELDRYVKFVRIVTLIILSLCFVLTACY